MLSILIPTYNCDCVQLVTALRIIGERLSVPYEIVVADDCSRHEFLVRNHAIEAFEHVRLLALKENLGPARIRNFLADNATYPYLLFLDSDVLPCSSDFLEKYLHVAQEGGVVCGGFDYEETVAEISPLRYSYGKKVESKSADQRSLNPYDCFVGMNFLVGKKVFDKVRFDPKMHFGYEDAVFGMRLKDAKVPVLHVENPVWHVVKDNSADYLNKIHLTMYNLAKQIEIDKTFLNCIRVYNWYKLLACFGADRIGSFLYGYLKKRMERNLCSSHPSLSLFAFYKLSCLCFFVRHPWSSAQ